MDQSTQPWYRSSVCITVGAILASWLMTILGPTSVLMPVIVVSGLVVLLRRRHFLAAATLLLFMPLGVVAVFGVATYASGQPALVYPGLAWTETHNLDPQLRCGRASSGCIVSENEWAFEGTNNLFVWMLIRSLGPIRGSYLGPYPTQAEATSALAGGEIIPIDDLRRGQVTIGDKVTQFDHGVGRELVEKLRDRWVVFSTDRIEPVVGTIFQEECLILRIPTPPRSEEEKASGVIVLISRSAGRPFAFYGEGSYYHHFPPVPWKRHDAL